MATYKQPCVHCGEYIERDAHLCPICRSRSPFGHRCPSCMKPIERWQTVCSGCGRSLTVVCPTCGQPAFADERCERCGASLMILCANPRCGEPQFFDLAKCTACGKKLKN